MVEHQLPKLRVAGSNPVSRSNLNPRSLPIYNGYWFWGRPSVVDLWHDLRAVTSEIRPDWDLSTPGLREAWEAGDFSPFHGWNKRTGQRPTVV